MNTAAIYKRALEKLPAKIYLDYVQYDDQLRDDQVIKLLDGRGDEVQEEIDEAWGEGHYHAITEYINDAIPDDKEREALRKSDLWDNLIYAIEDRNASDPLQDLIRQTGPKLFRYDLDLDVPDCTSLDSEKTIRETITRIAKAAGVPVKANAKAIRTMLLNASYGGALYVLYGGDLGEIVGATQAVEWRQERRRITWTDPHLLIHDGWGGSGWECQVVGKVTREFIPKDCHLDADRKYSWSEVCGGLRASDYECKCEITPLRPRRVTADAVDRG